jgi:hypothetical protein
MSSDCTYRLYQRARDECSLPSELLDCSIANRSIYCGPEVEVLLPFFERLGGGLGKLPGGLK